MKMGCISLSIGGGATGLVLYRGGRPFKIMSIPIGGEHITSDLATVLRVSLRDAEDVKRRIFMEDDESFRRDGNKYLGIFQNDGIFFGNFDFRISTAILVAIYIVSSVVRHAAGPEAFLFS